MEIPIPNKVMEKVFFSDRSLRDIYILNVDLDDWQKTFDWINLSHWSVAFYKDGQLIQCAETDVSYFFEAKESNTMLMSIEINGVKINCNFFSKDEIEFDIDPKEIRSILEANAVIEFMKNLSKTLDKECILTEENSPEKPLVTIKLDGTLIINGI